MPQDSESNVLSFGNPEFGEVRSALHEGTAVFCGRDVALILGYKNARDAISKHCKGKSITLPTEDSMGRFQMTAFIGESDVYRLVAHSKLPAAERFEAWIFEEVLPSIRRSGGYMAARPEESEEELMARALVVAREALDRQRARAEAAEARVAELRPKALLGEALDPESGLMTVTEAVRHISSIDPEVRRSDVFAWLREDGMLCKATAAPTRAAIDTGRLVAVMGPEIGRSDGTVYRPQTAKVTKKGLAWMVERYAFRRQPRLAAF